MSNITMRTWPCRITKEQTVLGEVARKIILFEQRKTRLQKPRSFPFSSGFNMVYNITWIIPKLRNPSRLWNMASTITFAAVGIFSKIFIEWFNKTTIYNKHIIQRALDSRPKNVPLITVSNHHSCFDDPGIWATLDLRYLLSRRKVRWSLAAHDICFTNVWHSYFFMLGKCIPVIRGNGIFQDAVDFCIEKLSSGEWVHVFPEGKVNMLKENLRYKWGIARLILESPVMPLVVPVYHLGMDDILPNEPPYILKTGKKVTMYYGEPIDFSDMLAELQATKVSETEARVLITNRVQDELNKLHSVAVELHNKN
ncbi:tafazzin [Leptopilina heterotoma]|uniref:tafazzin n=1 Tax=Leptopilina heterotoma TaxID=63436 RepID=UPI001CA94370|nr:tafazzin [Leptopilina heterotoma]